MVTAKDAETVCDRAMPAAFPVTFEGTVGWFAPARDIAKPVAVLFASPWGLEEMCSRKFFRILSGRLAAMGVANLRFDYPGTGDALSDDGATAGFQAWVDSFSIAAGQLRKLSGCKRIVVVGQGIGAAVAIKAIEAGEDCAAIALLAPVVSGRLYAREMSAMAQMINEKLRIARAPADGGGLTMAGLSMSEGLFDDIRKIELGKVMACPVGHALVFARAERPSDGAFAKHLAALGVDVSEAPFDGYAKLTTNPTVAVVPDAVVRDLMKWVADICPDGVPARELKLEPEPAAPHGDDKFVEQPIRFGKGGRMLGVVCRPSFATTKSLVSVILLSSGYDRMSGWGRSSARLARALAQQGIISFRFDCANVADSPPVPGLNEQVLYDAAQLDDVSAALDFLSEQLPGTRFVVAGRCSGAYVGLQAAWRDDRITGVVAVNPEVFEWQAGRSVEDALDNPTQSMDHYVSNLWRISTGKRILRGEIDLLAKARQVSKSLMCRFSRPLVWPTGGMTRRERIVCAGFRVLARRRVKVTLLYSPGDIGLEEFGHFFGAGGRQLSRFADMNYAVVSGADHNFTPEQSRKAYLDAIVEMASLP